MQPGINTQQFTINLPDDWSDKTMHIWTAQPKRGETMAANMVVAREALPSSQPLQPFIDKQMNELLNAGSDLEIISRGEIDWHGKPATEMIFSWNNNGHHMKQRQVYIHIDDVVFNIVFSSSVDQYDEHAKQFDVIQSSFQWV